MNSKGTKTSFTNLLKYAAIFLVAVGLGVIMSYSMLRNHPVEIEPTISIENLANIEDDAFSDDYFVIEIDGKEYEEYCEFDYKKMTERGLSFGEPVAYTYHNGHHYYSYYVPIIGLPEGEWYASFREDGSEGEITKRNSEYIWKKTDAEDVLNCKKN